MQIVDGGFVALMLLASPSCNVRTSLIYEFQVSSIAVTTSGNAQPHGAG